MLIVETIAKVRRAYFSDGKSIKAICRELRLSRKVVRKVIRSGETSFTYERTVQPRPKLGQRTAVLDDSDRQMVDILVAVLTDGLSAVEAACAEAIAHAVHSADVVLNILARRRDPGPPITIVTPAALTCAIPRFPIAPHPQEDPLMERTQIFDLIGEMRLYFDGIMATAVKRQHEPARSSHRSSCGHRRRTACRRASASTWQQSDGLGMKAQPQHVAGVYFTIFEILCNIMH